MCYRRPNKEKEEGYTGHIEPAEISYQPALCGIESYRSVLAESGTIDTDQHDQSCRDEKYWPANGIQQTGFGFRLDFWNGLTHGLGSLFSLKSLNLGIFDVCRQFDQLRAQ